MNTIPEEGCILTGSTEQAFIARFEGRLTQRSMWNMGHVVERYHELGDPMDVIIDVQYCAYMDSTILLARWALLCADRHHVQPFMIGLEGGELATVFRRMSLNRLFQQWTPPMPTYAPQRATSNEPQPADRADQMLRAHETLAELSPENTREFAQVSALLRGQETPHQTQTVNHEQ